jgi:quercetin dioxygenase-like cupin family protein
VVRGALGALAGIAAWVGWLTVCPALGFPTLAMAPMFNRVLVPGDDPGSWLGWALLFIGLASAALGYLWVTARGRLRPSIASGVLYGAICWLVAGAVAMPLLGLTFPSAAGGSSAPTPPDPMHGSFMMLPLGIGAPIAALIAWLTFGAVLGAAASSGPTQPQSPRRLAIGGAVAIVALAALGFLAPRISPPLAASSVTATRMLATEPAQALPQGVDYFSILELAQAPGGVLGPHAHPYAGFAYSLKGVASVNFADAPAIRVMPGEVGFIGTQAAHSHLNADDRLPSAFLGLLIVALAVAVCLLWLRPARRSGRLFPFALVLLVAAGAVGASNPWSNDWVFLSVRSVSNRGAPMPLPTSSRVYESADIGALPGRYVQTLEEITLAPGGVDADVGSDGTAVLLDLDGKADVQPAGGGSIQIGPRGATLLQPGSSVRVTNSGDRPMRLLRFALTPAAAAG